MPLGDSITVGVGTSPYNGYRKELYNNLVAAGHTVNFVGGQEDGNGVDNHHEGHSGWHADTSGENDILGQVTNWLTANPADIILLKISTNDAVANGQNPAEVSAILDEIWAFDNTIYVILANIIDHVPRQNKYLVFNQGLHEMAVTRIANGDPIRIVDMFNVLDYTADMNDAVHPNASGYAKMVDVWFPFLNALLWALEGVTVLNYGRGMFAGTGRGLVVC